MYHSFLIHSSADGHLGCFVAPVTSKAVPSVICLFIFFGFFCLQVSSGLISALNQGGEGGHLFSLTCSVVLRGGRNTANKYHCCMCGECSQCLGHTGFAPAHGVCTFLVYTAQAPGCSVGEVSKVGPGLRALLRSKTLRFRLFGTPQRHRLSWACVLCPSQVRAAQATRCLANTLSPGGVVPLITSPAPAAQFLGCGAGAPSQVCRMSPLWS